MQLLDQRQLVGGLDLAVHLVDAQAYRYRLGRGDAVAGGHDDPQARRFERGQGFWRAGLDRIGHRQQAMEPAVHRQVHDARAFQAQGLGLWHETVDGDTGLLHQHRVAERQ